MKTFGDYTESRDNGTATIWGKMGQWTLYRNESMEPDDGPKIADEQSEDALNSAVEVALKKGHKDAIVKFLRGLGDEQVNKELDDVDGGLGNVRSSNSKDVTQGQDEVVPSPVDNVNAGLE